MDTVGGSGITCCRLQNHASWLCKCCIHYSDGYFRTPVATPVSFRITAERHSRTNDQQRIPYSNKYEGRAQKYPDIFRTPNRRRYFEFECTVTTALIVLILMHQCNKHLNRQYTFSDADFLIQLHCRKKIVDANFSLRRVSNYFCARPS